MWLHSDVYLYFYKGLDLQAVQILDLVSYNQAGDEFDVEESLGEEDEL